MVCKSVLKVVGRIRWESVQQGLARKNGCESFHLECRIGSIFQLLHVLEACVDVLRRRHLLRGRGLLLGVDAAHNTATIVSWLNS